MASYYLRVRTIGRASVRGVMETAAHRSGVRLVDRRTRRVHDYRERPGVISSDLVLPLNGPRWARDRAALWNAAEDAERNENAVIAKEFEILLPESLPAQARRWLALDLAKALVAVYGSAVDVSLHAPDPRGHPSQPYAHLLLTLRRIGPNGFAERVPRLSGAAAGPSVVPVWRERFAAIEAGWLKAAGVEKISRRAP